MDRGHNRRGDPTPGAAAGRPAPGEVRACYEAGPTGYALQRLLGIEGVICEVVAPSLTPVKPGARVKTDRRDARKLGELFRAGLLTEVHPPSERDEALRDLCRCRDDVRVDLLRARHRLSKFLLRRHLIYRQTKHHWGTRHMQWLEEMRFDDAMSQATFDSGGNASPVCGTEASPPEPTMLESESSRRITVLRLWPGRRFNPRISA